MNDFEFSTCKTLICGIGSSTRVAELCNSLNANKIMLVTDQGLIDAGVIAPIVEHLRSHAIEVTLYSDVVADPPDHIVEAAAQVAKSEAINGVIGLGGGSSMDVAKLIAVLAGGETELKNCYGIEQIKGSRLPLILIPTTAGTGSEVTPISIVTTGETTKTGVISRQLLPDYAVLDANLTLKLPPHVTAATGIDAMVHAIEAYTSKLKKNFYSDLLAKHALVLLSDNITKVIEDGSDLIARQNMLLGSSLAGQAFANAPVAAIHALAYPLGGHFHIPHGLSNALVLLPVLRVNSVVASTEYSELLDCLPNTEPHRGTEVERAETFIQKLDDLIDQVGIPRRLSKLNINEQDLPILAKDAMLQQRLLINNPVEITEARALEIYKSVF